jgi:hypothetical protein
LPSSVVSVVVSLPRLLILAQISLVRTFRDSQKIRQTTQVSSPITLVIMSVILLAWVLISSVPLLNPLALLSSLEQPVMT